MAIAANKIKGDSKGLLEVAVLRPLAIFLLIVVHSFTVFNGSWHPFDGYVDVQAYSWIARFCNFMLPLFVFISGYVFSFQINTLKKRGNLASFIKKKFKRLLIPSIFFSIIYFYILLVEKPSSLWESFLSIISGVGHLWFLPMLFWVFLFAFFITSLKIDEKWKLLAVFAVSLFFWFINYFPYNLRIGLALYYLFYFYLGYFVYLHRNTFRLNWQRWLRAILFVFVVSFTLNYFYIVDISVEGGGVARKALVYLLQTFITIATFSSQILLTYLLIFKKLNSDGITNIPTQLYLLNSLCFGIYIYQQFILQILYYYTPIPSLVGPYYLPWIGLVITIFISYILSLFTHMTKVGRNYVG